LTKIKQATVWKKNENENRNNNNNQKMQNYNNLLEISECVSAGVTKML
jgi:hypothetical protein